MNENPLLQVFTLMSQFSCRFLWKKQRGWGGGREKERGLSSGHQMKDCHNSSFPVAAFLEQWHSGQIVTFLLLHLTSHPPKYMHTKRTQCHRLLPRLAHGLVLFSVCILARRLQRSNPSQQAVYQVRRLQQHP